MLTDTEFEFYIKRANSEECSDTRLVRTGYVPGTIVNYLHPEDPVYSFSGQYLASPSLVRLPSGKLLSSMDVHGPNSGENLTFIYASEDEGKSWHYVTEIFPSFWGKLFLDDGKLYMISVSSGYGDLLIGRSDNEGVDWSMPTVLMRGSNSNHKMGCHRAPMPILHHKGRIMTDMQYGSWDMYFTDAVLSAPEGADLLDPEVWSVSEFWNPTEHPEIPKNFSIEGNLVAAPDGKIYNILRYDRGLQLVLEYNPDDPCGKLTNARLNKVPISNSRTDILWDDISKRYYALASYAMDEPVTERNLLALLYSENLFDWNVAEFILDYRNESHKDVGFQYVSFIFDGDDILFLSRTAYNKANNFHDSNHQTFHRIKDFRSKCN